MKKNEQLIKELQMLVGNDEMNEIIEEKMTSVFYDGAHQQTAEFLAHQAYFDVRQRMGLSKEERERMEKSHHYSMSERELDDGRCVVCQVDQYQMFQCPQYCEPRCEKCLNRMTKSPKYTGNSPYFICQNEKCGIIQAVRG